MQQLLERVVSCKPEEGKYFYINTRGGKTYVDRAFLDCISNEGQKPCNNFGWTKKGGMVHLKTNTLLFPAEDRVSYATFSDVGNQVALKTCAFVVSKQLHM